MRAGIITSSASLVFLGLLAGVPAAASNSNSNRLVSLLDQSSSASLRLSAIPSDKTTEGGLVSIIASPGTASYLTTTFNDDSSSSSVLAWNAQDATLLCRGATLSSSDGKTTQALATTSVVASSLIVDGITGGDAQHLSESRHASTLTALFRAKLATVPNHSNNNKQTLILVLSSSNTPQQKDELKRQLQSLLEATAVDCGKETAVRLDDLYDVVIQSVTSAAEAQEVLKLAQSAAAASSTGTASQNLAAALSEATSVVKDSGILNASQDDPPHMAQAFVSLSSAHSKHARAARAKIAAWKSRVTRGLLVESFGSHAEALLQKTLSGFDTETLAAAGLPQHVASYRKTLRTQLHEYLTSSLNNLYQQQVSILQASTLKQTQAVLLKQERTLPAAAIPDAHASAMRDALVAFDTRVKELQVPSLSSTASSTPHQQMQTLLTNQVRTIADSPQAQLQRTKQVQQTVTKDKKPGQKGIDFGLDLVAVVRPDGYGSLQGYAGYQLGEKSSITFGIHNDADDPATIAQNGGVRPALFRVQPKLRVDVEL